MCEHCQEQCDAPRRVNEGYAAAICLLLDRYGWKAV